MGISNDSSDPVALEELGDRLRAVRLERNLSQQGVAEKAGVGRMTVQRLEEGESASLISLIRVLRALDALEGLDRVLPAPTLSPIDELSKRGGRRQRARPPRASERDEAQPGHWRWGDEDEGDSA